MQIKLSIYSYDNTKEKDCQYKIRIVTVLLRNIMILHKYILNP